jgi:hypothetical protein
MPVVAAAEPKVLVMLVEKQHVEAALAGTFQLEPMPMLTPAVVAVAVVAANHLAARAAPAS